MIERKRNEKLIDARLDAGHSQESLAKAVQASPKSVSRWETHSVIPQPGIRKKVGETLGRDPKELFPQRPQRQLQPKKEKKPDSSPTVSPPSSTGIQYVVNMTYEQARSHGIISSENIVQGSHERGEQEDEMNKRQFLEQGKNMIIGGLGVGISGEQTVRVTPAPSLRAEEFLLQSDSVIKTCWSLLSSSGITQADALLEHTIPTLLKFAVKASPYQPWAARLAAEANMIRATISRHQLSFLVREMSCYEAIQCSRIGKDSLLYAGSLNYLGYTYLFTRQPKKAIATFQEALHILGNASPLLSSDIYIGLADAYAQNKELQKAEACSQVAKETFPATPELDPSRFYADTSMSALYKWEARLYIDYAEHNHKKEYYQKAQEALQQAMQLRSPTQRNTVELLVYQASIALGLGNVDLLHTSLKDGALQALALESQLHYQDASEVYEKIPDQLRTEQSIKDLASLFPQR